MKNYRKNLIPFIFLLVTAIIFIAVTDMARPLTDKSISEPVQLATYTPTASPTPGWWISIPTPTTKGGNENNQ